MRVVLTGATGFLGSHLLRECVERKHAVVVLKRSSSDCARISDLLPAVDTWNVDEHDIASIFERIGPVDAIIHVATHYGRDSSDAMGLYRANVDYPMRLLEAAGRHRVPLFINTDTFFNSKNSQYSYLAGYTLSKRHFQEWGQYCGEQGSTRFVNARVFHMYGPGDAQGKFMPDLIERCLRGESIDLTPGEQLRDFVYVSDVVSAYSRLLEKESAQGPGYRHYDVGSGSLATIRELVELINRQCGGRATLNFGALPYRANEMMAGERADTGPLRGLGWSPAADLETGIQRAIDDVARRQGRQD